MQTAHWTDKLAALGLCADAVAWAREHDSLDTAWAKCKRGDWMLRLAGRVVGKIGSDSRRPLVLAACDCAELALPAFERDYPSDDGPRKAIETARAWARGDTGVTLAQVRAAADNAIFAAYAGAFAAAFAAAYAAAHAAANAAAFAATYIAAYGSAERARVLAACADIVRRHYPAPPKI